MKLDKKAFDIANREAKENTSRIDFTIDNPKFMAKYTIIEKYDQKWLQPINPCEYATETYNHFEANNSTVIYLGSRSVGETVDESEVSQKIQYRRIDITDATWKNPNGYADEIWAFSSYRFETRLVYVDTEPPESKLDTSIDTELEYWRKRCELAEKMIPPYTLTEFYQAKKEWESMIKQEKKLK